MTATRHSASVAAAVACPLGHDASRRARPGATRPAAARPSSTLQRLGRRRWRRRAPRDASARAAGAAATSATPSDARPCNTATGTGIGEADAGRRKRVRDPGALSPRKPREHRGVGPGAGVVRNATAHTAAAAGEAAAATSVARADRAACLGSGGAGDRRAARRGLADCRCAIRRRGRSAPADDQQPKSGGARRGCSMPSAASRSSVASCPAAGRARPCRRPPRSAAPRRTRPAAARRPGRSRTRPASPRARWAASAAMSSGIPSDPCGRWRAAPGRRRGARRPPRAPSSPRPRARRRAAAARQRRAGPPAPDGGYRRRRAARVSRAGEREPELGDRGRHAVALGPPASSTRRGVLRVQSRAGAAATRNAAAAAGRNVPATGGPRLRRPSAGTRASTGRPVQHRPHVRRRRRAADRACRSGVALPTPTASPAEQAQDAEQPAEAARTAAERRDSASRVSESVGSPPVPIERRSASRSARSTATGDDGSSARQLRARFRRSTMLTIGAAARSSRTSSAARRKRSPARAATAASDRLRGHGEHVALPIRLDVDRGRRTLPPSSPRPALCAVARGGSGRVEQAGGGLDDPRAVGRRCAAAAAAAATRSPGAASGGPAPTPQ